MAANSFTLVMDNTSDATFRAWRDTLIAQLDAHLNSGVNGWSRTADTGQVVVGAGSRVGASAGVGVNAGNYVCYQHVAAGKQTWIVRVDFCATAATTPGIGIVVGQATDGAGNVTGTQKSPRLGATNTLTNDTVSRVCLLSSGDGRFALATLLDSTASTHGIHCVTFERSVDAAGALTDDGVFVTLSDGSGRHGDSTVNGAGINVYVPQAGGVPNSEARLIAPLTNNASMAMGGSVGLAPVIPLGPGPKYPSRNLLVHHSADFVRDTQHSITVYGAARNYYILGPNWPFSVGAGSANAFASGRLAMLYE